MTYAATRLIDPDLHPGFAEETVTDKAIADLVEFIAFEYGNCANVDTVSLGHLIRSIEINLNEERDSRR